MPFDFDLNSEILQRLLFAFGTVLIIFIVVQVLRRLVLRYIEEPERRYRTAKTIGRIGGFVALLIVLGVLFQRAADLITVLTVVGAGLAIAMREALLSIAGWLYIAFRTPYSQGDRIELGPYRGDVIDIRLLHTTLMEIGGWVQADQSTGRIVHVPNALVFQEPVYNYTRGFHFIWNEIPFTVTFRSNWRAARELLLSLAQESAEVIEQQAKKEIRQMTREYLIHYSILTPFVYVRVTGDGVQLTLRYLCEARKRRGTEHAITVTFLDQIKEHGDIEMAHTMIGLTRLESPQFGPMPPATTRPDGAHDGDNAR
jgi:small-conductance mechanosensitive channel